MRVLGACLAGLGMILTATAAAQDSIPPAVNLAQLAQTLSQLDQSAQQTSMDLSRLRIDKWKTNSDGKRQAQADADSVRTNMMAALPGMDSAASNILRTDLMDFYMWYREFSHFSTGETR